MKVGDRVFVFEINRRRYRTDAQGRSHGPIHREHFVPLWIVGEAGRSWLVASEPDATPESRSVERFPKRPPAHSDRRLFDEAEMEDAVYRHDNAYRISEAVRRLDAAGLRKVAALIGYVDFEEELARAAEAGEGRAPKS